MWFDRRWKAAWAWFRRRPDWAKLVAAVAVFTSPVWVWAGGVLMHRCYEHWFIYTAEDREFVRARKRTRPEGLPSAARRLKAELEVVPDPETARQLRPDWAVVRLPSGDWLFGCGLDSHRQFQAGRGTLAVRDSRGQVRCFFGHVCGSSGASLALEQAGHVGTLDEFYCELQKDDRFQEWVPNP